MVPGDMTFSTLTWFGATGDAVTFTATPPPGAPTFMAPPSILTGAGEEPPQKPGRPGPPSPAPPLVLASRGGGGGTAQMAGWQIGLVVGLVVGVVLLLGLLILLWKRQHCCWGRKHGGMYETKVCADLGLWCVGRALLGGVSLIVSAPLTSALSSLTHFQLGNESQPPPPPDNVLTEIVSGGDCTAPWQKEGSVPSASIRPTPPSKDTDIMMAEIFNEETAADGSSSRMDSSSPSGPVSSGTVILQQSPRQGEEAPPPPDNARREIQRQMEELRDELRDGQSQWEVHEQIGKGGFGVVYKVGGWWRGGRG